MKLEVFLITFNRAESLERTLFSLLTSPLGDLSITVLDNHSTDDTATRVMALQTQHPNLRYHRQRVNIGASANALHGLLNAQAEYCWILCDDDELRPEAMGELLDLLCRPANALPDLVLVGGHARPSARWDGQCAGVRELIAQGCNFFRDGSFLPGMVYRSAFALPLLPHCYELAAWMYPHVALLLKAYERNSLLAVCRQPLVVASLGEQSYSQATHLDCWVALARRITDRPTRRLFLSCQWVDRWDPSGVRGLLGSMIANRRLRYLPLLLSTYPMRFVLAFPLLVLKRLGQTLQR